MRLFFALVPDAAAHEALLPFMSGVTGARWQRADQIHITVRFVGEVDARIADMLGGALSTLSLRLPSIILSGVGCFTTRDRPNALWLRAAPREPLEALHRKVDRLCQRAGLSPERRAYLPHMTVARLPRNAGPVDDWLSINAGGRAIPLDSMRFALLESFCDEDGSVYQMIASVPVA